MTIGGRAFLFFELRRLRGDWLRFPGRDKGLFGGNEGLSVGGEVHLDDGEDKE